jgi:type II secretory pathway component PulC
VAALGFRAGDVIVSVNGARLDDDMAALGLYMGLESTRSYNVTYERNGARASKSIALR